MKCPHCEKELPGSPCPECGSITIEGSNYCMECGAPLREDLDKVPRDEGFLEYDEDFDLEDKVLCPDGTCTGIIVDGRCTECGRSPEEAADSDEEDQNGAEAEGQPGGNQEGEKAG